MKVLAVRSIPLSEDTHAGWKSTEHDLRFMNRNRHVADALDLARRNDYNVVLNLGNSELPYDKRFVVTPSDTVKLLASSASVRQSRLGMYLPPIPLFGDKFWEKGGGRGGQNKRQMDNFDPRKHNRAGYDYQRHIDGTEYRVLTVGKKVVQVQKRIDDGDNRAVDREYEWVGLQGTPKAVKNFARSCAELLDGFNLVGWDIIINDGGVFLLEGNTCPGVNEATAKRILDQIEEDFRPAKKKVNKPYEKRGNYQFYYQHNDEPVFVGVNNA